MPKKMHILLNHWTIMVSMVVGGLFGAFCPEITKKISFLGDVYLQLLQITIIPIMMVALICSFCNIFKSNESFYYLRRIFFWFFVFTTLTVCTALIVSYVMKPGSNLSEDALQALSSGLASSENSLKGLSSAAQTKDILSYIEEMIPVNIIKSIFDRNDIAVVIFSVILGISLGVTKNTNVPVAVAFFDAMFSAFLRYVNGLMYILPFGLFFLISNFIAKVGIGTLTSLFDLILSIYIIVFLIFIILNIIMATKSKMSVIDCIKNLKNPYLIAFGTSSSFAAMPAAMLALRDNFKVDKQNVELVLPLGTSLFKPGIMVRCVTISIFLMSLYHVQVNATSIVILTVTTIICSIASTAGPAILSATMFSMILTPLGIPPAVGIFLLLSIEPIIDPVGTMLNVQSNCAVTMLVAKKGPLTMFEDKK